MFTTFQSPDAPPAVGPYSQAIEKNGFIFTSAQLPLDPVTGDLVGGSISEQTRQVCKNLGAVLNACGLDYGNVLQAVCYLRNMDDFAEFNAVYGEYFTHKPTRVCVAVSGLAKDAGVEISLVAARD